MHETIARLRLLLLPPLAVLASASGATRTQPYRTIAIFGDTQYHVDRDGALYTQYRVMVDWVAKPAAGKVHTRTSSYNPV